jgi:signal peptidase I
MNMSQRETNGGRNKWLALLMGLVMPGLGQIYNGELIKGVSYFIILLALYIVGMRWTVLLPDNMLIFGALCTVLVAMAIYALAVVDAYRTARLTGPACQLTRYNRWYFYIAIWLLGSVLVSGAVSGYVRDNFIEAYKIATSSMEPAVRAGDYVLADKTALRRMAPHKGDVVTFIYPDDRSKKFIKRIEGLPGDVITYADGTQKEVPHGFVYVLGDNREHSHDSRQFGFIPLSDVIAKVRQVYFSSGAEGVRWSRIGASVGSR